MRLLWMTVTWLCFGLSTCSEACYGHDYELPLGYSPLFHKGPVYFTPRGEGRASRRTIMNNGKSNHPRLKADGFTATLTDLRETDEGTYSARGKSASNTFYLTILECAEEVTQRYGHAFSLHVSGEAQYLEFIQLKRKDTTVLWNRTGSTLTKGKVRMNWNIIDIFNLTQADEGFYNLRRKDDTLVRRKKLKVEANQVHYEAKVDNLIVIHFPPSQTLWTVTYYADGETEGHKLINNGTLVESTDPNMPFKKRFSNLKKRFEIYPVESTDSGYFYFRDQDGNLAESVRLQVLDRYLPTYVYILVPVLIILVVIGCCCCVKKCCCAKSSSKTNESASDAQYHDQSQPSVTYSAAPAPPPTRNQPVRPVAPPPYSTGPSVMAAPSQPRASPAGFDVETNFLSPSAEPTFELKGSNFPSAPLLSSVSTSADVYTSDKLNFL